MCSILELRNKVLSIRDEDSGAAFSEIKSPLPTPKFYAEQSFSAKKDKRGPRPDRPPPTPRGKVQSQSSSSVSRLFSLRDSVGSDQAQSVSFRDSKSSLSSRYDSSSDKLYFHQCFEIICKLGSGSFGDVFKVKCKEDGKYYAVKRAKQKFAGKSDRDRKLQEVQKHEQLPSHINCVKFYKAWEEKQHLYIQTELCNCSLSQYADRNHQISESIIWNYLIDLLLAVKHLHDNNLVHLDIKPDNIFISEGGVCKLGDFGLVLDLSKSDVSDAIEGDPRYIAPELMQGVFTKSADIFSLGITILELASDLDLPRGEETWHRLRNLEIPEQFIQGRSIELIEVISLMMEPNYIKRLSADDILNLAAIEKVLKKRRKLLKAAELNQKFKTPLNHKSVSSDWSSSISDDVFEKDSNGNVSSINDSFNRKDFSFDDEVAFNDSSNNSFDLARNRLAMSTPCGFRYWDTKLHDTSGSPHLSVSKKKGLSPDGERSPTFTKSPRLQLFQDDVSDDEELATNLPPKNLLSVFNSLSPSQ